MKKSRTTQIHDMESKKISRALKNRRVLMVLDRLGEEKWRLQCQINDPARISGRYALTDIEVQEMQESIEDLEAIQELLKKSFREENLR